MNWVSNSADDPTFDALIEQAELDALWEATAPDDPAARGREEDRTFGDARETVKRAGAFQQWLNDTGYGRPPEASER